MATKSFRLRFTFWLDMKKPDEESIAETIASLKNQRSFVSTVREGIRLVTDLRAGRLDVLFELFPWVRAEFLEYMQNLQPTQPIEEKAIQKRLDSLEKLLLQQGNLPFEHTPSGPKSLTKPTALDQVGNDYDQIVLRKAKSDGTSSKNFLDSAFDLVQ